MRSVDSVILHVMGDEAILTAWYKEDGEMVRVGERVCEISTEKATQELEAFESGVLRRVMRVGDVVRVGDEVFRIEKA